MFFFALHNTISQTTFEHLFDIGLIEYQFLALVVRFSEN